MGIIALFLGFAGFVLLLWGAVQDTTDAGVNGVAFGFILLLLGALLYMMAQRKERQRRELQRHEELINAIRKQNHG